MKNVFSWVYIGLKMRFWMVRQTGDIGFFAGEVCCQAGIIWAAYALLRGVTPRTGVGGCFPATFNFNGGAIFRFGGHAEIVGQALLIYRFTKGEADRRIGRVHIATLLGGGVVNEFKGIVKFARLGVVRI